MDIELKRIDMNDSEKLGYRRTGESRIINDRMTITMYEKS